ncbi:VOC family protein [Pedobacter rhodius]|uniref:VOC family protein n=1 Tax=Pedobacter rhodius TaxID=3004098 RepID=A0ABT4KSL7_9SPHI|nr:VOC family protein [Pedobacter sp. SJ11]MCZ4221716.1 VOC family protein [Pedobacter sp. SJ11]
MEKAKLIGIAPQLVVNNVTTTAEYYRDVLGFCIIGYFMEPPVYAMVERDGYQIHFAQSDTDVIPVNEQFRKISTDMIIWVPEIDNFYNEVIAKGANVTEGIVKRVYGSREFVIKDCDGHKITIGD